MTRSEVELVFKHLNSHARANIEAKAYDAAVDEFEQLVELESANEDPKSSFSWDGITFEFQRGNLDRDELSPIVGVEPDESEIYDIALDFGWLVVENIREEIREMQEKTMFTPQEFVVLVLDAEFGEPTDAEVSPMSEDTFREIKESIEDKIEKAEFTMNRVGLIRGE